MRHGCRFASILGLLLCAAPGCQNFKERIELLEQENRWQEDEIYHLHYEMQEDYARLSALRRENESLKKELGITDGKPFNPRANLPSGPRGGLIPKKNNGPALPDVSPGEPAKPDDLPKLKGASYDGSAARVLPVSTGASFSPTDEALPFDQTIEKIVLDKRLTGGYNTDQRPGDDGILVMFQPQNAAGEYVPFAGETSFVLLDPNLDGRESQVAIWEFSTDEVATHFKKTLLAKGLNFDLRWPNQPPKSSDLRLYVRYISPQGKKLIAEQKVRIKFPPGSQLPPREDRPSAAESDDSDATGPIRPDRVTRSAPAVDASTAPGWHRLR